MELKQRKRINNLPKFNTGDDLAGSVNNISGGTTPRFATGLLSDSELQSRISSMKLPSQKIGFSEKAGIIAKNASPGTVSGAVNGTIGMIQGYNSMQDAVKGTDELMAYSGQRTDQAFGVNYQAQNDINRQKAMDDISKSNRNATLGMVGSGAAAGAAIGSAIPGVGTLIGGAVGAITGLFGGLFGSKKARERQRRKIFNAQQKVNLVNQVNQSSAATEGLTQQYYLDNGNTYDDILYANRGKDLRKPRYVKGK